jgi:outer membrane protein OmpA-like peptidoglycan-associated protein
VLSVLTLICSFAFSQTKEIDRANEFYNSQRYADAAEMFEEALLKLGNNEKRSSLAIKTKLAYCYRMNNKMDKAEMLYSEVVSDERAQEETYFYYGEALMSNGKYDEAKSWFRKYQALKPEDDRVELMVKSCLMVPFIEPYFQYIDIESFEHNSEADDNAPVFWKNGIVFSSDRKQSIGLVKEKSGWTGRDFLDLYYSASSGNGSFSSPERFSSKLNQSNKNTGNATFSKDGNEIIFTRNDNELNRQNTYNLQLYRAVSSGKGGWKKVEKLPFCIPAFNFMHPALSPDGKWLFFTSNKTGGNGGTDLWVVEKRNNGWGKPENLGPEINTPSNEGFPFVDSLGRLFFCSKGHPGFGGFDIFVTTKKIDGSWMEPRNLGKPINSPLDDISIFIDEKQKSGIFTSSRDGGDDDIFLFKILETEPEPPLVIIRNKEVKPSELQESQVVIKSVENTIETAENQKDTILEYVPVIKGKESELKAIAMESLDTILQVNQESRLPRVIVPIIIESEEETADIELIQNIVVRPSFNEFEKKLAEGNLRPGEVYRIEDVSFDANVWQVTPPVKAQLDRLLELLKVNPVAELEIGVHTESLGADDQNLILSDLRARMVLEYLQQEQLKTSKFNAVGYGETQLLNRCANYVNCPIEDHLYNNRLEIKIIRP